MTGEEIRKDFPIFANRSDIVYLDSGATSQRPGKVIEDVDKYYRTINSNPHRGVYSISVESTEAYESAREKVAKFINSPLSEQVIFTKNATEALNLIAYSYGLDNLHSGDEVVLSIMEHHSNLVPWQNVTKMKDAVLKYMYINNDFQIPDSEIEEKITNNTKIVGILSVSNVLGTVNDIDKIIKKAHSVGAVVVCDISQSIAHRPFDVQKADADFVVFSGHKMYSPLGIGVLYGKKELLDNMSPFLRGGDMIEYVYEHETTFAPLPNKFEAGTQNVGGAVGLASAIDYINSIGYETIERNERELMDYTIEQLSKMPEIILYTPSEPDKRSAVISFNIRNVHPHDVGSLLDMSGVCVRVGNHCAQPLLRSLKIDSTCRISFGVYNTKEDIDKLVSALETVMKVFRKQIG